MALEHKEIKANKEDVPKKKNHIQEIKDYLDLHYEFRKNVLTLEIEYRALKDSTFNILDDMFLNSIWIKMQMNGYKCSDVVLTKILNSDLTKTYNPLEDYFNALPEYDGVDYISQLGETIIIEDLEIDGIVLKDLWQPYLKKWLVASCMGKGINHTCLILVGGQGAGKTTWLNKLCPPEMKKFLVCSHINPSLTDQNTANFLAEKWFVNIDDQLETIFGKDFNSMKAIITAPFVTNRKTWHRFTKTRKRVCSFMGSVNNPKFLTDTENRRYIVFSTKQINFKHDIDMQKVWSQALHLANENFPYWFSTEEIKKLNKINEVYRQYTPEEEWLMRLFAPCEPTNPKARFLMPSEMLTILNAHSGMKLSIRRLSRAMNQQKYGNPISKRFKDKGVRKVYAVIEFSEQDQSNLQNAYKQHFKEDNKPTPTPSPPPELPLK